MVLAGIGLAARVQSNIGIIRAGVARGLSANSIQDLIRSTGQPGLRRQDLLAGIRNVRGIVDSGSNIRSVGLDRFPDPARIATSARPMLSEYSYDVRLRGVDRLTGERVDRFLTVRSDTNLTPRMIQDEAQEALNEAPIEATYGQLAENPEITVIGVRRRG